MKIEKISDRLSRIKEDERYKNMFTKKKLFEYGVQGPDVLAPTLMEENRELR